MGAFYHKKLLVITSFSMFYELIVKRDGKTAVHSGYGSGIYRLIVLVVESNG
jgi:hypothetical protein